MLSTIYALTCSDVSRVPAAKALAEDLSIPFIDFGIAFAAKYRFLLVLTPTHLELLDNSHVPALHLHVDFINGPLNYRRRHGGHELLSRAVGVKQLKKNNGAIIVDATAGLARDAFVLASLGFHVQMIELNAILVALVRDALQRAESNISVLEVTSRMTLYHGNALKWLHENATTQPDVIYLDPMYPQRQKSASVKKDMQILQALIEENYNIEDLLVDAIAITRNRVVVKRPRAADALLGPMPSFSIENKTTRFDIYLASKNTE